MDLDNLFVNIEILASILLYEYLRDLSLFDIIDSKFHVQEAEML